MSYINRLLSWIISILHLSPINFVFLEIGHVKEANVILLMNNSLFFWFKTYKSKCKLENEISRAMGLKAFSHFSSRLNTSLAPDQRIDR